MVVSIGVSWVVFLGFIFAEPLVTGGVAEADGVAEAGGSSGSGEYGRAVVVTGVGYVVETAFGEADTGFFSPSFGDFLFFWDTSVQPSSELGWLVTLDWTGPGSLAAMAFVDCSLLMVAVVTVVSMVAATFC